MNAAEQLDDVQELNEALRRECARNTQLSIRLQNLAFWSDRLTTTLAKICEAHLAGDTQTVMAEIDQMANAYKRNTKPINGSVH